MGTSSRWMWAAALLAPSTWAAQVAADVPFTLVDNRVFVAATLNGVGPFQMLLDTGAGNIGISTATMLAIGARNEGGEEISGAGEKTATVVKTHLRSLRIGAAEMRDLPTLAHTFGALNDVIGFRRFDGIAGAAVFRRYVVDIDFERSRLRLIEPDGYEAPPGAIVVPFTEYDGSIPLVDGIVAGVPGKFIVDLGDRSSLTLFGPFWRAHRLDAALAPGVEALTGYGVGGPIRGVVVRVQRFAFGAAEAGAIVARLSLQSSGGFADPAIAGSIGTGVLKHFHTVVDVARHRFVLEPRPRFADRYDRAGLWLGRDGARFKVFDVVAAGPADQAGLRTGDVVTAIDGHKAESLDLFSVRERLRDPAANEPVLIDYRREGRTARAEVRPRDLLPGG